LPSKCGRNYKGLARWVTTDNSYYKSVETVQYATATHIISLNHWAISIWVQQRFYYSNYSFTVEEE